MPSALSDIIMHVEASHEQRAENSRQLAHQRRAWTSSVRQGQIESRRLITDRSVIDAVLSCKPATVLDIGCGEGWLARALSRHGIRVTGLDAVPALIEQAKRVCAVRQEFGRWAAAGTARAAARERNARDPDPAPGDRLRRSAL